MCDVVAGQHGFAVARVAGWREAADRSIHPDQATAQVAVLLREQLLDRHVAYDSGIADVVVAVGKRQLQRFGDYVYVVGGIVTHPLKVEALQDVQRHQHDDAL